MTRRLRLERRDLFATLLLPLAVLAFSWALITPDLARRYSYPAGDFYSQFYTFASYEHDRLWAGQVPLWNPFTYGGHPFLADVQAAVFYPLSLLVMLLSGPGVFAPQWLIVEAIGHLYLGALFTYLFVRRLMSPFPSSLSTVAALVSALTFAFGGYLTGYPPLQLAILETQVWLPLILLLIDIGLAERRWRAVLGAGAAWGMALLAGHPQSAMYLFYGALAYALFRAWLARRPWHWTIAAQVCWIGVGFGLAAIHLLPGWEFMRLSVRAGLSYEELAGGFGLRDLAQAVLPGAFTDWSPAYVGIYGLLLAGVACVAACAPVSREQGYRARVLFWATLAVLSLVLSLGGKTFLYRLFYWMVPGFRLFRSQERAIYLTSLALSVLAGYGWIWLSSADLDLKWLRRARSVPLGFGVLATATAILFLVLDWAGLRASGMPGIAPLLRWTGFAWAAWLLLRWIVKRKTWWPVLSVALVVVDLFTASARTNLSPGPASERLYDSAWLDPVLEDREIPSMARGTGRFRIVNDFGLPGNSGCWLRLESMSGASPLRLQAHKVMADALPRWRLWELFDVRYVATWEHDLPGPFSQVRVAMQGAEWEKNTVYVHRLEVDFARAWIVHRARQVDDLEALSLLAAPDFDPRAEVLLAALVEDVTEVPVEPSTVESVAYSPEEIAIQVDISAPGWLVLGEWHYPGWRVWVDGVEGSVLRADYGLRAVAVPQGSHHIVFRYRPVSVYLGAAVSILTLVIWGSLFWVDSRSSRRIGAERANR